MSVFEGSWPTLFLMANSFCASQTLVTASTVMGQWMQMPGTKLAKWPLPDSVWLNITHRGTPSIWASYKMSLTCATTKQKELLENWIYYTIWHAWTYHDRFSATTSPANNDGRVFFEQWSPLQLWHCNLSDCHLCLMKDHFFIWSTNYAFVTNGRLAMARSRLLEVDTRVFRCLYSSFFVLLILDCNSSLGIWRTFGHDSIILMIVAASATGVNRPTFMIFTRSTCRSLFLLRINESNAALWLLEIWLIALNTSRTAARFWSSLLTFSFIWKIVCKLQTN